ncbi:hypothetical protein MKX01_029263 [Papaver californicum]|nr:hypothetical protein MKX01_029263 [Papaver californicum]
MENIVENESNMKVVIVSSRNSTDHEHSHQQEQKKKKQKEKIKPRLLIFRCILLSVGQVGGPLLLRLYYLHGGQRKWLSSWLQTAAFPILLVPLLVSWYKSKFHSQSQSTNDMHPNGRQNQGFLLTRKVFIWSVVLGIFTGLDSFLLAIGYSYLPVSVASLLMATQLAFTAVFALILVKQKFTPYSINSVVLLTLASLILAFHTNGDTPIGVSKAHYFLGFFMILGGAALLGFMLPLIEFVYTNACKDITYDLVMQMQFLISMFATVFSTIGMLINKDFQAISREAKAYGLGETKYYMVLIFTSILIQLSILGYLGVIFCATSLFTGVLVTLLVPVQQIFAIIFFHEKFNAEKGMSLALSIWGFASYFYGEYEENKKEEEKQKSVQGTS